MQSNAAQKYIPTEEEEFMNDTQVAYFKQKLLEWRNSIIKESACTIEDMQNNVAEPDLVDEASKQMNYTLTLRARDRERKLLKKIDSALKKIENGTYGYCEDSGEPISLKRLEARPIATLSIESQEKHEQQERTHKDN